MIEIINGNIIADIADYFPETPAIIPCEEGKCIFEEKRDGPVTWKECKECKQQIILDIRV